MLRDADTVGVTVGKFVTYGGGASAVVFGWSASEFAAFVGAAVAVLGLIVQAYFNARRDRREQAEFEARVAREQAEFEARMAAFREALDEPFD